MVRHAKENRWTTTLVALLIWLPAVGLSALQESRFHALLEGKLVAAAAPQIAQHNNVVSQVAVLETQLTALGAPARSIQAIDTELQRFQRQPQTYRTRIANLKAELADAEAYQRLADQIAEQRDVIQSTASIAADPIDTKQLGQMINIPWLNWRVPANATIWALIGWMMLVKSFGLHLLIPNRPSPHVQQPAAKPVKPMRVL